MKNFPLVSVLMTAYNREKYIAEAIESVLNSTHKDFELIIVDDVSKDNTLAIATSYAEKDSRVKVLQNKKNLGDYGNRNKAAEYARGKYIKYLDSDDLIESWGLEYCVHLMDLYPEAGWGSYYRSTQPNQVRLLTPKDTIYEHFYFRNTLSIGPTGTIIRRDAFEEVGGFDIRFGVATDNHFNLVIASKYPTLFIPQLFFYYREHDGQEKNNEVGYLINNYNFLKELLEERQLALTESERAFQRRKMDKRFSVNLVKYLLRSYSLPGLLDIMRKTNFTPLQLIKSLTY